ncbi:MAG TPA: protein-methionine-sulfoxide reductase heme-binding subunit MsrQ [Candidatus Udaeobacter sp.]|nr:protein-methionine-sulfoxide reductase heme-binding subunit MsrQ [Candidatus Udaeobacter sp.]
MTYPWQDRSGHLSPLKLAVFIALFAPGLWTAAAYGLGQLGPRPWTEAIHQTGLWAIRLLFVSLAVTPLRRVLQFRHLIVVRRMIGVAAFCYALLHFLAYAGDQAFAWGHVASEVILRFYLTIGFTALLFLAALAATSTEGMIRRLGGRNWRWLHRLAYVIGLLALTHYFIQTKLGFGEPLTMAGIYAWLMAHRVLVALRPAAAGNAWALISLSLACGIGAALAEAGYVWLTLHVDPARVLTAALAWTPGSRAGWIVFVAGMLLALAGAWRGRTLPQRRGVVPA